ncbi:restriction modification system, specificity subunit [Vibrio cholerae]|uniref:restriction endonuclease subunit S n=1 Tax=Vibrio cholerae TaxID=666 RepID=UPI00208557D0|nr:restriction endonuclease subunit S [Vibrio cholerae]GIB06432.1 restriction modification system, specificity subunit [Vibrio cholerae]
MTIQTKAPDIRFENFSGDWQDKGIGSILAETRRPVELLDNELYQLVTVKRRNEGVVARASLKGKDILVKNYFGIKSGDYLISKRQVVHGANGIVPESLDNAVVSNEYLVVTDSDEITAKFWTVISKRHQMHKLFFISSYGVDIEKLVFDVSDWKNRSITIPDVTEQNSITDYFQKLDNLINQHQQKHEKLTNIKKSMLEKMFPKQGETIPEIRFKGFSGEWDEIGLLDSIERIIDFRGRTPKKLGLDWSPSGYRALSALNVKQGYIDFSIDPHFGDQELYDKWMNGSELHQGQVLFTTEAPMGNVAQVPNADKYILSQRTIAFVVKREVINEDFLAVLLRSFKVFRELTALSSGGTAKGVSQKVLSNLYVLIPTDLEEQTTIGNYFQKLDALINQHQQQITKLTNIKQACLSKMFV